MRHHFRLDTPKVRLSKLFKTYNNIYIFIIHQKYYDRFKNNIPTTYCLYLYIVKLRHIFIWFDMY